MQRQPIDIKDLVLPSLSTWNNGWFLLAAGDFEAGKHNCMTVAWGSFGTIWERPIATVAVRPTRYTYEFMEAADDFTLTQFGEEHRGIISDLGTRSGRDMDKINDSGLTPIAASKVASPAYDEAELIVECRKIYTQDLDPARFGADYIEPMYNNDYHRIYWGEVIAVSGTAKYAK